MKNIGNNPSHKHQANHIRGKNKRGNWLAVILFRISRRDFGFCLTALFLFCLGSLFWQLNGGPPNLLQDIRYYFGKQFVLISCGKINCGLSVMKLAGFSGLPWCPFRSDEITFYWIKGRLCLRTVHVGYRQNISFLARHTRPQVGYRVQFVKAICSSLCGKMWSHLKCGHLLWVSLFVLFVCPRISNWDCKMSFKSCLSENNMLIQEIM